MYSRYPARHEPAAGKGTATQHGCSEMIQFDFNSLPKQENQPLEAPLNKKWMDFKVDLKVPRSLIDTTKVWKPESYVRMEPYTIWTRFGEDPVYDVLMAGRPKQWKISWTLNPNRIYADEEYGRSIVPSTGRMYEVWEALQV